jgi:hypothetical protein
MTPAGLQRLGAVLMFAAWPIFEAAAQEKTLNIAQTLERAGVIDRYFPEVAAEVAGALVQAAPGKWRGVRVNQAHRSGWLNIYLVDARRLPEDGLLASDGIDNLTRESLRAGALVHEESNTIFLNTAMWKRLAAATLMTQAKVQPDLTAALATVDAVGLDGARRFWDPATLSADTPANKRVGWLMRGALAFVLAHEMGHILIGRAQADEPDRQQLSQNLTPRQLDEMRACPELMHKESRQRQKHEMAADLAGVALLGRQCQIGADGKLRHAIYLLGTTWYFTASMSDKLIEMGRNTDSKVIANALSRKLGPDLYQRVIAAHAAERRRGAVKFAFPSTHPPDTERMRAIETALRATPCGGGGLDSRGAQQMEMFRQQMCRQLVGGDSAR